jgi:hypothetical protein
MADTFLGDMSGSTGKAGRPGEAGDSLLGQFPPSEPWALLETGAEPMCSKNVLVECTKISL